MFRTRKQSTTTYPLSVLMVSSADHSTPQTGKTVTATLSKNGGAFASASGAVSEVSAGIYTLAGNATDRNTLGSLIAKFSATGCDDSFVELEIVPYDVFATGVDVNIVQIAGATTAVSGSGSVTFVRGQSVANGSNFPTNFASLVLAAGETGGTYEVVAQQSTLFGTVGVNAASVRNAIGMADSDLDTQLDAIAAGSGQGSTVTVYTAATYAGSTPPDSGLPITLYRGCADTISPPSLEGYAGGIEDGDEVVLRIVAKDVYEDISEDDDVPALVEATTTASLVGGTLTLSWQLTAEQTGSLPAGADGSGRTVYKVIAGEIGERPVLDRDCVVFRFPAAPV